MNYSCKSNELMLKYKMCNYVMNSDVETQVLKMKSFLKILTIAIVICVIFCGCKSKNVESDITSVSMHTDAGSKDISISETESSTVSSENSSVYSSVNEAEFSKTDAQLDPQNAITKPQDGAEIKVDRLQSKTGKANGVDVSKWQGEVDWKRVKNAGVNFAIIRIGYRAENGKIYKDTYADYNIQQADKAGLLIGVYFFSTAISKQEALEEAKWTAEQIKSYSISYPVVYDCEGFLKSNSRMYNISKESRTENAVQFLSHITSLGYDGMFYAAKNELENNWNTAQLESKFKIWVAHYPQQTYPQVTNPDYSGKYDMWQYTNKGQIAGISGDTDLVVSYFTKEKASPKSQQTVTEAKKPEPVDTTYKEVNEQVTAKDEVNLRDAATTNSNIIGKLKNGEILTRIATGSNGWSKLKFNGTVVYAVSSYLTTDTSYKPPTGENTQTDDGFKAVNDKVTAKNETNLRTKPTTGEGSEIVGKLKNGEFLNRIGKSDKGWSKLIYNGQTVYAVTDYLTDGSTTEQPREMIFTSVNEQVTAKDEVNLRTKPTTGEGSEIAGKLKNGEFLTRTGTSAQGWSRLEYNGQTVYAVSSYLTLK